MVVTHAVVVDEFFADVSNEQALVVLGDVECADRLATASAQCASDLVVEVGHAVSEHGVDGSDLVVGFVIDRGERAADE